MVEGCSSATADKRREDEKTEENEEDAEEEKKRPTAFVLEGCSGDTEKAFLATPWTAER